MKKVTIVLTVFILSMIGFSINGFGQTATPEEDFFIGNWELIVKNTPMGGDMNSTMIIDKTDDKLSGSMTMGDPSMGMTLDFTAVEVAGDKLTVTFDMMGQPGQIIYTKEGEKNITGTLMDSPIEGTKKEEE